MKILVTGAGALLGQGIIRALQQSGRDDLQIITADPSPLSAGLYWTEQRYLIPKAADPDFSARVEGLVDRLRPDLLIPGTDVELMPLALQREHLESRYGVKVIVASPRVIEIADDKYKTFEFFRAHGFDAPESCLPGGEQALAAQTGFPLIVKPRNGARSIGLHKVRDMEELQRAIRSTKDPVIQECVGDDDQEYTAGTLCFGGECRAAIVMRRDLRDGNTYRAYVDQDPVLTQTVRRFAEVLGARGPANFQFRIGRNGQPKVFEINARFSGTTPLRALAGFNEVEMCVRHLVDGAELEQPPVRNVTILRHWSETVIDDSIAPPVEA